jgi:exopolyphosphatase/guanosine-5'-triphosphate,3'-diphosphate pyrophosphatase
VTGTSTSRVAPNRRKGDEQRVAIIDLGSNTFRLVVFRYRPGGSFALTDEIREAVRLSAGATDGALTAEAIERATTTARTYATFCATAGIETVVAAATSAIRDASNQAGVLAGFADAGLHARVLSTEEEAYYGYLGVANSMAVEDGLFVDIGGGSAQVGRITRRALERSMSAPIGAVRMTEQFFSATRTKRSEMKLLRKHIGGVLDEHPWFADAGLPIVGIGGTIRTLAAMGQRAAEYPLGEIHGYRLTRDALGALIDDVASRPVGQRHRVPGLKADRADIILAGAVTLDTIVDRAAADALVVCSQGLREGLFYEHFLSPADPPIVTDVRRATIRNVAGLYRADGPHTDHVARLAIEIFDGTGRLGCHDGDPREREWLWAAAMLHDVGVVVDYHDHHKHGFYLVLNAGLPGFEHRELAMIAMLVRGHRKAAPTIDTSLAPLMDEGDDARLLRLASCLRLAEQLERDKARNVTAVAVEGRGRQVTLRLRGPGDHSIAMWSASQDADVFERAFGRRLRIVADD